MRSQPLPSGPKEARLPTAHHHCNTVFGGRHAIRSSSAKHIQAEYARPAHVRATRKCRHLKKQCLNYTVKPLLTKNSNHTMWGGEKLPNVTSQLPPPPHTSPRKPSLPDQLCRLSFEDTVGFSFSRSQATYLQVPVGLGALLRCPRHRFLHRPLWWAA